MATTYHGAGTQSPTALSKPIERVFEDAQHTGEIQLSGRKLREYPKIAPKYDLVDTISTDLSKNRLNEVPKEVCGYASMEKLNCYHNVIKSIPDAIVQLQALTYLNLSRNQLSIIPSFISQLQTLEVLIASHNRLVSLPEEIGVLDKLMELDVSCNQISHLPLQIGDLKSLKSLNLRRNFLVELPIEIGKLNLRKLDFSSNRISKIPTVFRKIETLEQIILENNPLTLPPAHICTKGKQHIMKFLQKEAIRDDKKRGILNDVEMKRFRKSLPPQQSVSSEEFRNLLESPDKWKRHTVLSSDSGYSTTDSVDKCGWSPQEVNSDTHLEDANILAYKAATAASVIYRDKGPSRNENQHIYPPPVIPTPDSLPKYEPPKSPYISPKPPPPPAPMVYPPSPLTPQTPPTPQGPGPGIGSPADDDFTRELQRQKLEYESKKKVAEQLRRQQEEEDEREQRRRAAQKLQDEQKAMLERQREESRAQEEQARAWEEARKREAEELQRQEDLRKAEEARQQQQYKHQEEARNYRAENKKPVQSSSSFKEEKRNPGSSQPYRRTVSDSNQRLPAHTSIPVSHSPDVVRNGPIEETVNGQSPVPSPVNSNLPSPNTTQNTHNATLPHHAPPPHNATVSNVSANDNSRPSTPQGSIGRRPKVGEKVQQASSASNSSRVAKPTERHGRATTSVTTTRTGLPGSKKNHLTQDEELRKSQQDLKSSHTMEPTRVRSRAEDQRLKTIQKESNAYNRRSSGSTSSEDDKKRATPTRLTTFSSTSAAKRSGTGMSSASSAATRATSTRPSTTSSRTTTPSSGPATTRRAQSSTTTSSATNKSKRSGAVMSNATVKMIEQYKDSDPNFTIARQQEHHREEQEHLDKLRKTISSRLKRSLPDNLSEALSDGVLLCHLANQIRPRSVASVHVPSPAVPKLTPAKCRRNVDNFLEACRKIGVQRDQICNSSDILEEKSLLRVAATVAALVSLASNSKIGSMV